MENRVKQNILERFRSLANECGIKRITMDLLARECSISKKTIYKYFSGKDEIVQSLLNELIHRFKTEFQRLGASSIDPLQKVFKLLELPFVIFDNVSSVLVRDISELYPEIERKLNKIRKEQQAVLMDMFISGVKAGHFKDINPSFVIAFFSGAGEKVFNSEFILKNNMTVQETISSFQEIMLSGMLTKESRNLQSIKRDTT